MKARSPNAASARASSSLRKSETSAGSGVHTMASQQVAASSDRVQALAQFQAAADASPQVQAMIELGAAINAQHDGAVQRRATFKSLEEAKAIAARFLEQLLKHKGDLSEQVDPAAWEFVTHAENKGEIETLVGKMIGDEKQDFGSFDLESPQSVLLLFYQLAAMAKKIGKIKEDVREQDKEERTKEAEDAAAEYEANREALGPLFEDVIVLGTGASVAYCLTANAGSIDREQTLIIGQSQPWDPTTETGRGDEEGKVNHPLHMIHPDRREVGYGDEELTGRKAFSDEIAKVVGRFEQVDAEVTKVSKINNPKAAPGVSPFVYQVETDKGAYFARKVVAGLGIGPHTPRALGKLMDTPEFKDTGEKRLIMNMDEFQRRPDQDFQLETMPPESRGTGEKGPARIVVAGGNAAIDVVMRCIRRGLEVVWVVGSSDPALLTGTDNEFVKQEYRKAKRGRSAVIKEILSGYVTGAERNGDKAEFPLTAKTGGGDALGHFVVYGMGPDIEKNRAVFVDKTTGVLHGDTDAKLEATLDTNRQFGDEGPATVVGLHGSKSGETDTSSLEIIGGTAARISDNVQYDYFERLNGDLAQQATKLVSFAPALDEPIEKEVLEAVHQYGAEVYRYLMGVSPPLKAIQDATKIGDLPPRIDGYYGRRHRAYVKMVETGKTGPALALVGRVDSLSSAIDRFGEAVNAYRWRVQGYLRKVQDVGTRKAGPDPRFAAANMSPVVESLPINVAGNDQLAPIRSEVEADTAFVPSYIEKEVNFATDSSTVLAIHIAVKYPFIEPGDADAMVKVIIESRRPSEADQHRFPSFQGPIPNPLGESRETAKGFTERWERLLTEANRKGKVRAEQKAK